MLAKVFSCAVIGLEGAIIQVEVDISRRLLSFTILGVTEQEVRGRRPVSSSKGVSSSGPCWRNVHEPTDP